jgi:fatty acid synthase
MATGKHIGKVVLKVRDEEDERIVVPKPHLVSAVPRTYINPDKSYILIGNIPLISIPRTHFLQES